MQFDGVMNNSTVYLNGKEVGGRPYGYSSFTCDLTPALNASGPNVLAVRVDHEDFADCRWYQGSGIYRNVFLNVTDKVMTKLRSGAPAAASRPSVPSTAPAPSGVTRPSSNP